MTNAPSLAKRPTWNTERDGCQIGNIEINRVVDLENSPFAADLIYPDSTPEIMETLAGRLDNIHFGDTSSDLYLSFHSYLIRTTNHTILVDLCCGNDKHRPTRPHWHMALC